MPQVPQDFDYGKWRKSRITLPEVEPAPGFDYSQWRAQATRNKTRKFNLTVKEGKRINPEFAAQVVRLQGRTGLPASVIAEKFEEIAPIAFDPEFDGETFRNEHPIIFNWIIENGPFYAGMTRDDILKLGDVETFLSRPPHMWPKPESRMREEADEMANESMQFWTRVMTSETLNPSPKVRGSSMGSYALDRFGDLSFDEMKRVLFEEALEKVRKEEQFVQGKDKLGFFETLQRRFEKNPFAVLPIAGQAIEFVLDGVIYEAAKAVENGTATPAQRRRLISHARIQEATARRGRGVASLTAEGIAQLPTYAAEFAGTAGIYSGIKALVIGGSRETAKGVLAGATQKVLRNKVTGFLAASGAQTAVRAPFRIAGRTVQRMTPGFGLSVTDDRQINLELTRTDDNFLSALTKAAGAEFVETMSERAGFPIQRMLRWAKLAAFRRWALLNPSKDVPFFVKTLRTAAAWDGIIPELFEERVAEVGLAALGIEPYRPPTAEQFAAEVLTFAPFSVLGASLRVFGPRIPEHSSPEMFQQLGEIAKQINFAGIAPEKAEELFQSIVAGTPAEFINAPIGQWISFWQKQRDEAGNPIDPRAKAIEVVGSEGAYEEAVLFNHDLVIPMSRYLTTIARSPENEAFMRQFRMNPREENEEERAEEAARPKEDLPEAERAAIERADAVIEQTEFSREEKDAAKAAAGIVEVERSAQPFFEELISIGMSEKLAAEYAGLRQRAKESTRKEVVEKQGIRISRENERDWVKAIDEEIEKLTPQINDLPVYKALSNLEFGTFPDGTPLSEESKIKLSRQSVLDRVGKVGLQTIPEAMLVEEGGWDIDGAAEILGFNSGEELILAIQNAEDKGSLIRRLANEAVREVRGRPMTEEEVLEAAEIAYHNEDNAKKLRLELEHMISDEFAKARDLIRRIAKPLIKTIPEFRRAAEELIGDKKRKEIQPALYLTARRRALKESIDALLRGDLDAAIEAKQTELLNHELYRAAINGREEFDSAVDFGRGLQRKSTRERIGKTGGTNLEQIEALTDRHGLRSPSAPALGPKEETLETWYGNAREEGFEPAIDESFFNEERRIDFRDMTLNQMRDLRDALQSIDHIAGRRGKVIFIDRAIRAEEGIDSLVARAEEMLPKVRKETDKGLQTWRDRFKEKLIGFDASLVGMEILIEALDGGPTGPFHDLIFNRAAKAQSDFLDLQKVYTQKIEPIIGKYNKDNATRMNDKIATPLGSMSRYKLISILFNMGTESSLERLLRGHEWTEREGELNDSIRRLTPRDLEFVQEMWDIIDTLWPNISSLHRRIAGVPLPRLDRRLFTVELETGEVVSMKGGYFPLKYDPELSEIGRKQETGMLAELVEPGYTIATIAAPFRKGRTKFAAPILFDYNFVLQQHLVGVIKDLTYREFLIDANKILRDPRVRKVIQERLGSGYEQLFIGSRDKPGWLRAVANEHVTSRLAGLESFGKLAELSRSNVSIVMLGYKISVVTAQLAGFPNVVEYISDNFNSKLTWDATQMLLRNLPKNLSRTDPDSLLNFIEKRSGEMRNRFRTMDRDLGDLVGKAERKELDVVRRSAVKMSMYGILWMERPVAMIAWLAAYNGTLVKQREAGETNEVVIESRAVGAGDAAVRRTQGAGAAKDLPALVRQRGVISLATMFYTPFAAQYGRLRLIFGKLGRRGLPYLPEALIRASFVVWLPNLIADLLAGRTPDCEGEEDKIGCAAKWAAIRAITGMLSTVPLARELSFPLERFALEGRTTDIRFSPVLSTVTRVGRTAMRAAAATVGEKTWNDELAFDTLEGLGYVFGIPVSQVAITGEFLTDLLTEEAKPEGAPEFIHDLLFRRPLRERRGIR